MKFTRTLRTETDAVVFETSVMYRKAPRVCFFSAVYFPGPSPTANHRGESKPASAVASQAWLLIHRLDSVKVTPMNASEAEAEPMSSETIPPTLRPKSNVTEEGPWKVAFPAAGWVKTSALLTEPLTW